MKFNRILVIKTSSMGDILHTLPALTDALQHFTGLTFDWVVENNFSEIPAWHPAVERVICFNFRHWRKKPFSTLHFQAYKHFFQALRTEQYDYIIDAQGLLKSAWIGLFAHGQRAGFAPSAARERLAGYFYQKKMSTDWRLHAILRMRQLFADTLGYSLQNLPLNYGLDNLYLEPVFAKKYGKSVLFLHGTTWLTKTLLEQQWIKIAQRIAPYCDVILVPWGNETEKARALTLAAVCSKVVVLPSLSLAALAAEIQNAQLVYAVDTGLAHLASALNKASISFYAATDPALTGTYGAEQVHFSAKFSCSPCFLKDCTHSAYRPGHPPCYDTLAIDRAITLGIARLEAL